MSLTSDKNPSSSAIITVVMPAYNHAKYVIEAIDSVRNQTFENWKLIVIDDGSTDDTWAILNAYVNSIVDARIQIFTQTNAGSHATLNRGLNMADSPYLAILNSDDRFSPERLQHLMEIADSTGHDIFIATGVRLIDETGLPINDDHWWQKMYRDILSHWYVFETQFDNPAVQTLMWGNFTVSTSNFFLSRSIWQHVGNFKHFRYVPDWDYALRVASEHPSSFIYLPNDKLMDYRLHGRNTILGGALRNHAEALRVLRTFQKKWVTNGHRISEHAINRLHYLSRFIRHEHARQMLGQEKANWAAQREQEKANWENQMNAISANLEHRDSEIAQYENQISNYQEHLKNIFASRSWQLTSPLRSIFELIPKVRRKSRLIAGRVLKKILRNSTETSSYDEWLKGESIALERLSSHSEQAIGALSKTPLISIVMPVHDTPAAFLQAAVDSVTGQWYKQWELCICNDASSRADTLELLGQLEKSDARIRVTHRAEAGHIVLATNDAIGIADGKFIVFLDHDDQLAPQALLRLVQKLDQSPDLDFIYSDEDKIDSKGRRSLPFFKPDWSPVLLWSQNYIGHLMCIRRSLLLELGSLKLGTQGSQDHDLVLRLATHGAKISHLPEVLYHWRMHSASTSSSPDAKPYAHQAGKEAVARHLEERYGDQFDRVDDSEYAFVYRPRFKVPPETTVSIIIPTRDHAQLLHDCIDSIHQKAQGIDYEIIVLDNGSQEPATHTCFKSLCLDSRVQVIQADIPFNWSRLNNIGRRHAKGQVLVFLNNDTIVISPDWLLRLSEIALLPDVATVGPLLLYPDGAIQHAGVVVGMGGWADHVFKGAAVTHYPSPFVSSVLPRNVLANTGACVAIATKRFDQLGGFDEAFQICGSDVELGIRAHNQGYHNIYLPDVRLYHLESKTRSPHVPAVDFEQSDLKYAPYRLGGDPFFNPNLDLFCANPTPRFPAQPVERPKG